MKTEMMEFVRGDGVSCACVEHCPAIGVEASGANSGCHPEPAHLTGDKKNSGDSQEIPPELFMMDTAAKKGKVLRKVADIYI